MACSWPLWEDTVRWWGRVMLPMADQYSGGKLQRPRPSLSAAPAIDTVVTTVTCSFVPGPGLLPRLPARPLQARR